MTSKSSRCTANCRWPSSRPRSSPARAGRAAHRAGHQRGRIQHHLARHPRSDRQRPCTRTALRSRTRASRGWKPSTSRRLRPTSVPVAPVASPTGTCLSPVAAKQAAGGLAHARRLRRPNCPGLALELAAWGITAKQRHGLALAGSAARRARWHRRANCWCSSPRWRADGRITALGRAHARTRRHAASRRRRAARAAPSCARWSPICWR